MHRCQAEGSQAAFTRVAQLPMETRFSFKTEINNQGLQRLLLAGLGPIIAAPTRGAEPWLGAPRSSWPNALVRAAYNSRNAVVTGNLAARTAGNRPPMKPIANAHLMPVHSNSGVTRNWNTTWLKLPPTVDAV